MQFDTTVGGASATSYASADDLDSYAETRLPAVSWLSTASGDQKEFALMMAARLLDKLFRWTGTAAVAGTQRLAWPRAGMLDQNSAAIAEDVLPQDLKDAQCEFAIQLGAADRVSDDEVAKNAVTAVSAGSVSVSFANQTVASQEAFDVYVRRMSSEFSHLSRTVPQAVRELLVPSWYEQPTAKRSLMFGAM